MAPNKEELFKTLVMSMSFVHRNAKKQKDVGLTVKKVFKCFFYFLEMIKLPFLEIEYQYDKLSELIC